MLRFTPKSLQGQLMLAIALALLLAQGISAGLRWRAQADRRETALVHAAALRIVATGHDRLMALVHGGEPPELAAATHGARIELSPVSPLRPGETRLPDAEQELRRILDDQLDIDQAIVVRRDLSDEPQFARRIARRAAMMRRHAAQAPRGLMLAAIKLRGAPDWLVVRVAEPAVERGLIAGLLAQTLLIYALLIGASWLIVRRITRPLAALTTRVEHFAETRDAGGQLDPQGPHDVRRLIVAHNAMEARVAALLDEKDVMLGAIGHDLKTPLSALRVRIESVEDEAERAKMAATIEDITRSLDDILSLARVGRPSDPKEPTELSALVAQVAEEFEDMGEAVTLGDTQRITLPVRVTWLRRALRNLISNALRYGGEAKVSLARENGAAVIRVADAGPGIPEHEIARMLEPFTRGEPSRNSETGGAGLGLTLARAIAEQHGGALTLTNTRGGDGEIEGLVATLRLPTA